MDCVAGFEKGDIVRINMQTQSPSVDAKGAQSAGDAVGAVGDLIVAAPALAADDAVEELVRLTLLRSDLSVGL